MVSEEDIQYQECKTKFHTLLF